MDTQRIVEELESKYNPECDLILNAPEVTMSDYKLLAIIKDLLERVSELESTVQEILNPW